MKIPRLMIAGTGSNCGKTTVSTGIMSILKDSGLRVQPFKVGPDYIDPMFHRHTTGRPSSNLDSWLLSEGTLLRLFANNAHDADISVIEGVMGFYDGYGVESIEGSSAHVAGITRTPVILVADGSGSALSIAAAVKGFRDFTGGGTIKAVIFNNVHGDGHYRILKDAVEKHTDIRVAGYLERTGGISLESRHLGLVTSAETVGLDDKIGRLKSCLQKTLDMDLVLQIANDAEDINAGSTGIDIDIGTGTSIGTDICVGSGINTDAYNDTNTDTCPETAVKLAVAYDKAFCFYYDDNFKLLRSLGAELVFFSPLEDESLPRDASGIYLGGGYPEVWAANLQENVSMRSSILDAARSGMPVYGECGGMMYLADKLVDIDGKSFDMAGAVHGTCMMTGKLQRFGYAEARVVRDCILAPKGSCIRVHEYHCSVMEASSEAVTCFEVVKCRNGGMTANDRVWDCGYSYDGNCGSGGIGSNLLAGYPHLHFLANPVFAAGFIGSCALFAKRL